ncbi:hypothetical protein FQR65_LT09810 [Abscondita terminalis]|nr:hypothetical protein FQR65_LT09810 [Abscondita terminalis]
MANEFEELKKVVTGILVSSPLRLSISKIDKDYEEIIGERIPFRRLGFTSLEGCLRSMTDILEIVGSGPRAEVILFVTDKSSHINKLVTKQKTAPPKRNRFGSRRPFNNYYRKNISQPKRNNGFYHPPPLMSISIPRTTPVIPRFASKRYEPPPPSNTITNNRIPPVENSFSPILKHSSVTQEIKEPVEPQPAAISCNGTIPKQTTSHFLDVTDSDLSDDCIYLSDTDDEIDISFFNSTQNVQHIPPEQFFNVEEEDKRDVTPKESFSWNIPSRVQDNLRKLISQYDDGLWCGTLPEVYKKMFKKELEYAEFGYRSLISMCLDLTDVFYCIRPDTGDFKLYDRRKDLPKDYDKSIKVSQMFRCFRDNFDKPSTEPAVIDIADEVHSNFQYPDDVLQLNDTIVRQFLPKGVEEDDYIDVCVGEVYDPSKFWVLLDDFTNELNNLMDQIQTFYTSESVDYKIPEHMITVGLYCVAPYNKEYHRALIVNTINSIKHKVKVYYIDYGTVSAVDRNSLKFLHKNFVDLPQQAIRARLASIYPPTEKTQWTLESSSRLLELVSMKKLVAHIHRIDVERQIIEIFLADTTGANDVYMNDTLVEDGHAIFTNQEQARVTLDSHATPWVKHIHFFPTFVEIENSAVPSADEMIRLQKVGIPIEQIYPRYFVQANTQDEVLCNDLKNVESIDLDTSKLDKVELAICTKPPPGYERFQPRQFQLNDTTQLPQRTFNPCPPTNFVPMPQFSAQPQQMYYHNYQPPFFPSYHCNQYLPNLDTTYQNEREILQNIIYESLIRNTYSQFSLTQYLVQQGQWEYTLAPNEIFAYLSSILNTATPISDMQRNYLLKQVLKVLTNQQIVDIMQRLSETRPKFENPVVNSVSNLLQHLNLNYSENITYIPSGSSAQEDCSRTLYKPQINETLVAETDFNNQKIYVIWYRKEAYVNVEDIMQLISNNIPIENIRKQIVMMDPSISIIDLPLNDNVRLYEELSRFKKDVDKGSILHVVPLALTQKVLNYLGSTLDVSVYVSKVTAKLDLLFGNKS